jgi:hypothetical protein
MPTKNEIGLLFTLQVNNRGTTPPHIGVAGPTPM